MNNHSLYRKSLATALLFLIFLINLYAVYCVFNSPLQAVIFGAVLGIQTLLILTYHLRCLECDGCMEQAGKGIWLFYKVFAVISFLSIALIFMDEIVPRDTESLKVPLALIYAILLIMGISTAFKAIIGVKNISEIENVNTRQENPHAAPNNETPYPNIPPEKLEAWIQQQETYNKWQREKQDLRDDAAKCMQAEERMRQEALKRLQERNSTYRHY